MILTDLQKDLLIRLVRARLDGGKHFPTYADLSDLAGVASDGFGPALDALSAWFAEQALPDVAATVIPPENAARMRMLPADTIVTRLGGEAAARAEAERVRDFDWAGWLAS